MERPALALLVILDIATASQMNVTVDDQNGDAVTGILPAYSPAGT